jgi:hypothetical protein
VNRAAIAYQQIDGIDQDKLVLELESLCTTLSGNGTILEDSEDHKPWLSDRKSSNNWDFWERYQLYLEQEKGWAPSTVNKIEQALGIEGEWWLVKYSQEKPLTILGLYVRLSMQVIKSSSF